MRVLGVLAGTMMPPTQLALWAEWADVIIAADGGANALHIAGAKPHIVVGDLDSAQHDLLAEPDVVHDPGQHRSDCDKLLALVSSRGFSDVVLANVEGDHPDHFLGTLASATRSPLRVHLALTRGTGEVLVGPCQRSLSAPAGCRLSLMPLEACAGVTLSGVQWPLNEAELSPRAQVSLSNKVVEGFVEVSLAEGSAVLFLLHPQLESPPCD